MLIAAVLHNYQPPCKEPRSARISNAAGWTMCCGCKPANDFDGPVWHKKEFFVEKEEKHERPGIYSRGAGSALRAMRKDR